MLGLLRRLFAPLHRTSPRSDGYRWPAASVGLVITPRLDPAARAIRMAPAPKRKPPHHDPRKLERAKKYRGIRFKPGQRAPVSGQYLRSDGIGFTVVYREPFPPAPRPRLTYRLTDPTR